MIHVRLIDGEKRYRAWSHVMDGYMTPPMTLGQLVRWYIEDALERCAANLGRDMPGLLRRLEQRNTSSRIRPRSLTEPWEEERTSSEDESQDAEQYIAGELSHYLGQSSWDLCEPLVIDGKCYKITLKIEECDWPEVDPNEVSG